MKSEVWTEKIKHLFTRKDHLLILILTGVLLLVIAWPVESASDAASPSLMPSVGSTQDGSQEKGGPEGGSPESTAQIREEDGEEAGQLERELEELLSLMQGVGRTRVMITLESTRERIVEKDSPTSRNNVVENDAQGGSRSTNELQAEETTVYITNAQGEQIPYVTREVSPVIEGVTVVAEGGGNAQIQKNITEVIQALFGLEAHKIKVVKMKQE